MIEETGFWLFNCNPAIWDIKTRLQSDITEEDWGIPNNRVNQFKKGQLGVIRVAQDKRSTKIVDKKLLSGFYALVEIIDKPFYGKTKNPKLFFKPSKFTHSKIENVELKTHWRVPIKITENLLESPILISDLKISEFKFDKGVFQPGQGVSVRPLERKSFFELLKHIGRKERTWLQDIIQALENLNGEAHFKDIKAEVKKIRKKFNPSWDRTVQKELERHSSDSDVWKSKWKGKEDLFYNKSKGKGVWGLRSFNNNAENLESYKKKLEEEVKKKQNLSLAELKKRAGKNKKPKKKTVSTPHFERDVYVVAYVLKAAKGKCDLCSKNAPFKKKKTNEPYLECHHVKLLARGGEDIIDNAVALCPNCHRKMHSLGLKEDTDTLKLKIQLRK